MEELSWEYRSVTVTKYNPELRDSKGKYPEDEWVSYGEIGRLFDAKVFTLEEYYFYESNYIQAAKYFLNLYDCKYHNYENYIDEGQFLFRDKELIPIYNHIQENKEYELIALEIIMKLILRGYIWCSLTCKENPSIEVRFGGDYYMFFVSDDKLKGTSLQLEIERLGLFMG